MSEFKEFILPKTNNEVSITQEEKDEIIKNQRIAKFILQEMKDLLEGQIRSVNMVEYRNTYVYTDYGILDADNPLIIDFELIDEMVKLVSCKFSFKIRNFREGVKNI